MREPYQVLVIPFRRRASKIEYAILRRSDADYWQFVAGGGENNETPLEAAKRETEEELGIPKNADYLQLDSKTTVPKDCFSASDSWGGDIYVIPEYCFAVDVGDKDIIISLEHNEYIWTDYDNAREKLKWDSNKNALWELNERLKK